MAQESTLPTPSQASELGLGRPAVDRELAGKRLSARLAKRLLRQALAKLDEGEIVLIDRANRDVFGSTTDRFPVSATIRVLDSRFYPRVLLGGSIGAGEAYAEGLWASDDLTSVIRVLVRNRHALEQMEGPLAALSRAFDKLYHRRRDNTHRGSRRNIAAHYDLGNEFFSLFLDPTMMYSSAVFPDWTVRLDQAAVFKLDLICQRLDLGPGDEVVEIGTGWGGFAIHAARSYGCRVVTTTISRRQHEYATKRIAEEGLDDRVQVLLEDYRSLPEVLDRRFHKLVSIEMIEAVGHRHLPDFFETVDRLLKDDGTALIQAITIRDQQYEAYRHGVDFIQRHIFPGGLIPSLARMSECVQEKTDMVMTHLEDIGPHYAETLAAWRERFLASKSQLDELGLDDVFQRLWEFYFCYCEGAFRERNISAVQALYAKPLNRNRPIATTI